MAVMSNRCVTGRRPQDNHAVRFWQKLRIVSRSRFTQPIRGLSDLSDDTACKGVPALAPPGSRKKIWEKKKSPRWVYISPSIFQTNNKLWALFKNKMRDIFLWRRDSFVHYLWLCSWWGLWDTTTQMWPIVVFFFLNVNMRARVCV